MQGLRNSKKKSSILLFYTLYGILSLENFNLSSEDCVVAEWGGKTNNSHGMPIHILLFVFVVFRLTRKEEFLLQNKIEEKQSFIQSNRLS